MSKKAARSDTNNGNMWSVSFQMNAVVWRNEHKMHDQRAQCISFFVYYTPVNRDFIERNSSSISTHWGRGAMRSALPDCQARREKKSGLVSISSYSMKYYFSSSVKSSLSSSRIVLWENYATSHHHMHVLFQPKSGVLNKNLKSSLQKGNCSFYILRCTFLPLGKVLLCECYWFRDCFHYTT